ncbi:hypothetical protein GF312_12620 [Candidatus Poribacteria bacterium]|nr:hypothetical protein [Candidatus Poribacteria bacterium]
MRFLLILLCFALIPQVALGQEYKVKPGDTINITVWERDSLSGTLVVDANGFISLPPPVGSMKIEGQTAPEITNMLTQRLEEYVKNPTVFVSVIPAQGFTVHVLGEVKQPDFYQIPVGTSMQEAVTRAGGFTDMADLKRIKMIREDSKEAIIDFTKFIENADISANPELNPNDVIVIPRLSREQRAAQTIAVTGAVNTPGTFEMPDSMSLVEVLSLAGWPTDDADTESISVMSVTDGRQNWAKVDFKSFMADGNVSGNPRISPGEMVFVPKLESLEDLRLPSFSVNVVGQVLQPGIVPVKEGDRLFDAISTAGGLTDDASIRNVAIIHRKSQSPTKYEFNLDKYLKEGDLSNNPELKEGDTVFVPIMDESKLIPSIHQPFRSRITVSIIGSVSKPSTYKVSADSSILDVLKLAGGPTADADLEGVTVVRKGDGKRLEVDMEKVLTESDIDQMIPLQEDDTIFVPTTKSKRELWSTIVKTAAEISTVFIAYILITTGTGIAR